MVGGGEGEKFCGSVRMRECGGGEEVLEGEREGCWGFEGEGGIGEFFLLNFEGLGNAIEGLKRDFCLLRSKGECGMDGRM